MTRWQGIVGGMSVLVVGLLSAGGLLAGGWGVLTIRDLPDHVVAGEPFELTFALRGHGRVLSSGLTAAVDATRGTLRAHAVASPASEAGYYTASLVLPEPGEWTLRIQTSYGERQAIRLPLRAIARGSPPPVLAAAVRGQRLFVAKGCATCHRHDSAESNHPSPVGPALQQKQYTRGFLEWRLGDAASASAAVPAGTTWTMPDLELSRDEIAALVAFLAPQAQTASATETWRAVFVGPMEGRPKMVSEMLFHLEIDGSMLAGMAHMAHWPGTAPIADGQIDGERISFTVVGDLPWCSSSASGSRCGYPHLAFTGTRHGRTMTLALDWGSLIDGHYVSGAEWPGAGPGELRMLATKVSD